MVDRDADSEEGYEGRMTDEPKSQSDQFKELARELELDEDEGALGRAVRQAGEGQAEAGEAGELVSSVASGTEGEPFHHHTFVPHKGGAAMRANRIGLFGLDWRTPRLELRQRLG